MSRRRRALLVLALLGLGIGGLLIGTRVRARGRYVAPYSTFGSGPEGTRGAFLLAGRRGLTPSRWTEDLAGLPDGGMLLALGGCESMRRELGRLERERLMRWIEAGGVLVVAGAPGYLDDFPVHIRADDERCGASRGVIGALRGQAREEQQQHKETEPAPPPTDLADAIEEELEDDEGELAPRLVVGSAEGFETMPGIGMRIRSELELPENVEYETLLRIGGPNGRPVGVRVPRGEGAVIVLASASPFQNRDLAEQGGGVLLARLIDTYGDDGAVRFDEYHLGIGAQRSLMRFINQLGGGALVLQLLFMVLIGLYRAGSRFGGVREPSPTPPAGTASYVEGVGALYARSADAGGASQILLRRVARRLAAHFHLGAVGADRVAQHLEGAGREALATRLRQLTERAETASDLASFAVELDRLVDDVLAADAAVAGTSTRAARRGVGTTTVDFERPLL